MEYRSGYIYPYDGYCLYWLCSALGSICYPFNYHSMHVFLPAGYPRCLQRETWLSNNLLVLIEWEVWLTGPPEV